jgi:excisionase family DNA binding protein
MEKLLLTPREAAAVLGIGRSKLYELLQAGQIPSVRIGKCRRVPAAALRELVERLSSAADDTSVAATRMQPTGTTPSQSLSRVVRPSATAEEQIA